MGNFADNLRELRKKMELTQEELAGFLNVSFQTISKWERQERYPDITMLPVLAGFFGVSVDELLGVEESDQQLNQKQILQQWEKDNAVGKNLNNVKRMRMALKKYPGNYEMMAKLVNSLEKCQGTEEEMKRYRNEAIELSERIIRHCPDTQMRNDVLYNICYSYWNNGERQLAIERAGQLSRLYKARENALVMFLEGEEKVQVGQKAVVTLVSLMYHQISCLCRETHYTSEEKKFLLEQYLKISELLFEKDDIQEILHCRVDAYVRIAEIYLEKRDERMAIDNLKCAVKTLNQSFRIEERKKAQKAMQKAAKNAVQKKAQNVEKGGMDALEQYSQNLLTNAILPEAVLNAAYKKYWLLTQLEDERYDFMRNKEDFVHLLEKIR